MFLLLPRGMRGLAALLTVGIPVLATGSVGGLLFTLVVAPLAFAAYRWRHTGESGRLSLGDIGRAAAVGVAVSTTQVAWFPIPFLLLGIFLHRRPELGSRRALRVTATFTGLALLTFLLINAPFIVWSPRDWLHGVLAAVKFSNNGDDAYSATIAAEPQADTPECGLSDGDGAVRFRVSSDTTHGSPVYFQSYGWQGSYGRFGFSGFVVASWQ